MLVIKTMPSPLNTTLNTILYFRKYLITVSVYIIRLHRSPDIEFNSSLPVELSIPCFFFLRSVVLFIVVKNYSEIFSPNKQVYKNDCQLPVYFLGFCTIFFKKYNSFSPKHLRYGIAMRTLLFIRMKISFSPLSVSRTMR